MTVLFALLGAGVGFAQTGALRQKNTYLTFFYGSNFNVLGSEDPRRGGGLAVGFGRPERRLRMRNIPGELVLEGYVANTFSPGASSYPRNTSYEFGALAISRYEWRDSPDFGAFFDVGFGAQFSSRPSVDLDSRFNTTPMLGGGAIFPVGDHELLLGVRFLHISNAGTRGNNQGQNRIYVTLTLRL